MRSTSWLSPAQNPNVPVLRVLSNCRLVCIAVAFSWLYCRNLPCKTESHHQQSSTGFGVEDQPSRSRRGGDLYNGDAALQEQSHQGLSGTRRFIRVSDAASRKVSYQGLLALGDPYKFWQARIASAQSPTEKGDSCIRDAMLRKELH